MLICYIVYGCIALGLNAKLVPAHLSFLIGENLCIIQTLTQT
jgi:hypothetical protein